MREKKEKKKKAPLKRISIVTVCGSGVVTSSMVAVKLREQLMEHGFDARVVETNPGGLDSLVMGNHFDLIACISPVNKDYGIPKVDAKGMIAANDEQVIEDCLKILKPEQKQEQKEE